MLLKCLSSIFSALCWRGRVPGSGWLSPGSILSADYPWWQQKGPGMCDQDPGLQTRFCLAAGGAWAGESVCRIEGRGGLCPGGAEEQSGTASWRKQHHSGWRGLEVHSGLKRATPWKALSAKPSVHPEWTEATDEPPENGLWSAEYEFNVCGLRSDGCLLPLLLVVCIFSLSLSFFPFQSS